MKSSHKWSCNGIKLKREKLKKKNEKKKSFKRSKGNPIKALRDICVHSQLLMKPITRNIDFEKSIKVSFSHHKNQQQLILLCWNNSSLDWLMYVVLSLSEQCLLMKCIAALCAGSFISLITAISPFPHFWLSLNCFPYRFNYLIIQCFLIILQGFNIYINGSFHCCLRYKQLHSLHDGLKRSLMNLSLPQFPPKKLLTLTNSELDQRRLALERYMQLSELCNQLKSNKMN